MASSTATDAALVWFRRDLRLADNPALSAAVESGRPLVLAYIHDTADTARLSPGEAADWWLHGSLESLRGEIEARSGQLTVLEGETEAILERLVREHAVRSVYINSVDWPWMNARDKALAERFEGDGVAFRRFQSTTLVRLDQHFNGSGGAFRVFSAFWRAALKTLAPNPVLPAPERLAMSANLPSSVALDSLKLRPSSPNWAAGFPERWTPGERHALDRLYKFLDGAVAEYSTHRDRPDLAGTSRLSPHLAWGEISPRQIWHASQSAIASGAPAKPVEKFLAEIGWRDFAYYLLHHFPDLREQNFNRKFDAFPWRSDDRAVRLWQRGETGVPMVDAGMRELWSTGWMHNRVRMITGSYLVKHIGVHWREGMAWFEHTLVDADPAVNAASWQWVAGSGADAAPYFRIFNPVTQGEKFDPNGEYVSEWVPHLKRLQGKRIHAPWAVTRLEQIAAGIPDRNLDPVVALDEGRNRALAAYQDMKSAAEDAE